ncbi:41 kDa spicule matrix protein [Drosophila eugracilis]|uniref:41 kDa spicule matrix protein n=1 Tax=Drosophila eugracilis TaxID=29029 RepID=UPI0007E89B9F|nr:41 kDa spicule matrix protein [Drosophila eugracilis]
MWKCLGFLFLLAGVRGLGQQAGLHPTLCGEVQSATLPLQSQARESLLDPHLSREKRQQQIVQEVIVENNFGGPGFGGPGFGGPGFGGPGFGGPGFGGPGFGGPGFGRPGLGRPGFGGPALGGFVGRGFARSNNQAEEDEPRTEPNPFYKPLSEAPSPACPKNHLFSCEAVIKPVPCGFSRRYGL